MFKVIKTDFESLEGLLNGRHTIVHNIIPIVEGSTTLFVVIYKEVW